MFDLPTPAMTLTCHYTTIACDVMVFSPLGFSLRGIVS